MSHQTICPCGTGVLLENCCKPIINGTKAAITAEELMRSRYTAFTLNDIEYLKKSHHRSSRPSFAEGKAILKWSKQLKWIGLTIKSTKKGMHEDEEGHVEFIASYIENGQPQQIHENSFFVKEAGIWYYKSGMHFNQHN